jgi:hypothetical protein
VTCEASHRAAPPTRRLLMRGPAFLLVGGARSLELDELGRLLAAQLWQLIARIALLTRLRWQLIAKVLVDRGVTDAQRLGDLPVADLRRVGRLITEMPKAKGVIARSKRGQTRGSAGVPRVPEPKTLADQGVDKNLADRGRKAWRMTEEQFERLVAKVKKIAVASAEQRTRIASPSSDTSRSTCRTACSCWTCR